MFIGGKFARPVAARKFVHQELLENKSRNRIIIVQAPSGFFLTESLSASLEEEGNLIVWLRFSLEDFDPGICLVTIITALQRVNQNIGANTLQQMRLPPGPIQGWSRLYELLAHEVADNLSKPATFVLENLHFLNSSPHSLLLLGRHFLDLLPSNIRVVLTTQEQLPPNLINEDPAFVKIRDLKLSQQSVIRLLEENNLSLSVDLLQRAIHLMHGSAGGLMGIFRTGQYFGKKYIHNVLKRSSNQFDILNWIVRDWLEALDENDVRAMMIFDYLGYNHPEINQSMTGKRAIPPAPWEQKLSQNWMRLCNLWRRSLNVALHTSHSFDLQPVRMLGEQLTLKGISFESVRLYIEIRDYLKAAQQLEQISFEMMGLGQWELLRYWLALLPEQVIGDRAWLLCADGEIKTAEGRIDAAQIAFRRAAERFMWDNDNLGACTSLLAVSKLANDRGDYKEAYVSALQACRIAQAQNLSIQEAWAEFQLGCLSVSESDATISAYHFEQATELVAHNGDTSAQEYFYIVQSMASARENQQRERKLQYKRYVEMRRSERIHHERLRNAVTNPMGITTGILADQNWLYLPLLLKYSGKTQLGKLSKLDRLRLKFRWFIKWSWRFPGYWHFLKLWAIVERYLGLDQIGQIQEIEQLSISSTQPVSNPDEDIEAVQMDLGLSTAMVNSPPSLEVSIIDSNHWEEGRQTQVTLAAYLLGGFKLSINDILLEHMPAGNSGILLKYLIHHRKRSIQREELIELFWPGTDPDSARNRLNVIMSKVRKALRGITDYEIIIYDSDRYFLNPELSLWVDVDEFENTLAEAAREETAGNTVQSINLLEVVANLYQGDYLMEDIYEEWTVPLRGRLRLAYLDALYRLCRNYFQQRQYAACVSLCQSILELDNCREDVHCLLMRCYARQGQYHLGLRQYQSCFEILHTELDIAPSASTVALYERLRRREVTEPLPTA